MGMIRNVLVLGAVVALLPTDQAQQSRLYEQAAQAARWTVTFCDRNTLLCNEGQALWATFTKKAEFGAGLVYNLVQQQLTSGAQPAAPVMPTSAPRGTLRPDDLQPDWRAPGRALRPGA